jgi:hypothetical protein
MSKWLLSKRPRAAQVIVACGFLVVAAIAARIAVIVADLHSRALADHERELQNIALVLAGETDRTFQVLDLLAESLTERMETLGIRSSEAFRRQMSSRDIHVLLKQKVGDMPRLEAIALFDANGDLINFSRSWPIPRLSITQQEHFRAFASDPNLTTYVSRPFANQTVGTAAASLWGCREMAGGQESRRQCLGDATGGRETRGYGAERAGGIGASPKQT